MLAKPWQGTEGHGEPGRIVNAPGQDCGLCPEGG